MRGKSFVIVSLAKKKVTVLSQVFICPDSRVAFFCSYQFMSYIIGRAIEQYCAAVLMTLKVLVL